MTATRRRPHRVCKAQKICALLRVRDKRGGRLRACTKHHAEGQQQADSPVEPASPCHGAGGSGLRPLASRVLLRRRTIQNEAQALASTPRDAPAVWWEAADTDVGTDSKEGKIAPACSGEHIMLE